MHHCLGYAAFQKLSQLLGNYGAAEKVALALAAIFLSQKMELFLGLHALGHYAVLEAPWRALAETNSWCCFHKSGTRKMPFSLPGKI